MLLGLDLSDGWKKKTGALAATICSMSRSVLGHSATDASGGRLYRRASLVEAVDGGPAVLVAGEAPTVAECAAKSLPLRRTSSGLPSSKSATGGRSGSVHSGAGLRRAPANALCMLRQGARQAPLPPKKKQNLSPGK